MLHCFDEILSDSHIERIAGLEYILLQTPKSHLCDLEEFFFVSSEIMDFITESLRSGEICRTKWSEGCSVYIRVICSLSYRRRYLS